MGGDDFLGRKLQKSTVTQCVWNVVVAFCGSVRFGIWIFRHIREAFTNNSLTCWVGHSH